MITNTWTDPVIEARKEAAEAWRIVFIRNKTIQKQAEQIEDLKEALRNIG